MAKSPEATHSPMQITSAGAVHLPSPEPLITAPITDWVKCMTRIEKYSESTAGIDNAGWAMIGVGGSALLSAFSLAVSIEFSRKTEGGVVPNWVGIGVTVAQILFAGLGMGGGFILLGWGRDKRRQQANYKADLIEDMRGMQHRCLPPAEAA